MRQQQQIHRWTAADGALWEWRGGPAPHWEQVEPGQSNKGSTAGALAGFVAGVGVSALVWLVLL